MNNYIKLIDKNYNSRVLINTDILARQTKTYDIRVIDNNDYEELLDATTKREVLFMNEEQFTKFVNNLKCVKTIEKQEIVLYTKKGIFKAHRYMYHNGDRVMNDKDYRQIIIHGCNYQCTKLECPEYSYEELDEFSNKITEKEGVGTVDLHHLY